VNKNTGELDQLTREEGSGTVSKGKTVAKTKKKARVIIPSKMLESGEKEETARAKKRKQKGQIENSRP